MSVMLGVNPPTPLGGIAEHAAAAERMGFDGITVPEFGHDPLVALTVAAASTRGIRLAAGVLIAFARNPMTVAVEAADVQSVAGGRLVLGLGSQVRPHIERRFSMPWSRPAPRMREFVQALHAIWDAFETGDRLDFRGEFYQHTLLTPMFNPGAVPFGRPPVWIAGVGEVMTRVAGEVGDGYVAHPFTTARYLHEVSLPALREGRRRAGRAGEAIETVLAPLVAVGSTPEERESSLIAVRRQLAFYASTPAYRPVMELHGWGELADSLHAVSKRGQWSAMGDLLTDDVVAEFAFVGDPAGVASQLAARLGDIADSVAVNPLGDVAPETLAALRAAMRPTWQGAGA